MHVATYKMSMSIFHLSFLREKNVYTRADYWGSKSAIKGAGNKVLTFVLEHIWVRR
jgi:hypothetical protein